MLHSRHHECNPVGFVKAERRRHAKASSSLRPAEAQGTLDHQASSLAVVGRPSHFDLVSEKVHLGIGDDFFGRPIHIQPMADYFNAADDDLVDGPSCVVTVDGDKGQTHGALVSYYEGSEMWAARTFKCPSGASRPLAIDRSAVGEPDFSGSVGNLVSTCLVAADPTAGWH